METHNYLNTHANEMLEDGVELHPLRPFLPNNAKVLFLGSFPPQQKRWSKGFNFYYPNFINDHWRIEGLIFFDDKDYFVDQQNKTFRLTPIIDFLKEKGIALFDTCTAIRRLKDNASDKFLEVVQPTDIKALLQQLPQCRLIVTTGEKATETLLANLGLNKTPKIGTSLPTGLYNNLGESIEIYRLPSSSRAYPMNILKKAEYYRQMFIHASIIADNTSGVGL